MPEALTAGLSALILSVSCIPVLIPVLRRLKFGQHIRKDGPQSHLTKTGIPTMGGFVFLLAIPTAMLISGVSDEKSLLAVFLILSLGLLGCIDDFLKIRRKNADGLSARQKMAGQILIAALFTVYLWRLEGGRVWLPLVDRYLDLGVYYIPVAVFVIVATANGVNFTDGLDGLCAGVTFIVAAAFYLLCRVWGLTQLIWLAASLAGSCLGFLIFNLHPAKLFMGDTGSLALGGAVSALALLSDTALLLPLLGVVYVMEVASVILQRRYFRYTGGKRLFRMAPLHHHFELSGWSENRVDFAFWSATVLSAALFLWILI